jgi:hypothetical protein
LYLVVPRNNDGLSVRYINFSIDIIEYLF